MRACLSRGTQRARAICSARLYATLVLLIFWSTMECTSAFADLGLRYETCGRAVSIPTRCTCPRLSID